MVELFLATGCAAIDRYRIPQEVVAPSAFRRVRTEMRW